MRFAAYAGTSMVLATGVVIRALNQRANFYSASVYLAQSNACLMILTNLVLLGVCTVMIGLQRLLYGPLRAIEVEQLYEKAWFAITETCLAMTIFRDEVGGWFLVMFVCLLTGKVWSWIGEGRVDVLEQQPPANPRLFHTRLSFSLSISIIFDLYMLRYSVQTVVRQARPNMMVMFAFEFAVLTVTSLSIIARYALFLYEASIINAQTRDHLERRRAQRRQAREGEVPGQARTSDTESTAVQANEGEDIDVDVPGWEEKGRWVFYLDLTTDFCKLVLYLTFFCVLCMFYGMPIHIIRDVAFTIRSFYKRIADFIRYRHATRDMNQRYPDATPEEISREDVCIICREDMRPWGQLHNQESSATDGAQGNRPPTPMDERLRAKKLPCGHILHFACLRSWLERQQNCPICRRPVLITGSPNPSEGPAQLAQDLVRAQGQANQAEMQGGIHQPAQPQNRIRMYNIGPFRLGFGAGQNVQDLAQQLNNEQHRAMPAQNGAAQPVGFGFGFGRQQATANQSTTAQFSSMHVATQLHQIEQQLMRDINGLRLQADQLQHVRALQGELARLRITQANPQTNYRTYPQQAQTIPLNPVAHAFAPSQQIPAMGPGHQGLPQGMRLPDGWTLLPLQRLPQLPHQGPHISIPFPQTPTNTPPSNTSTSSRSISANTPIAYTAQGQHDTAPTQTLPTPTAIHTPYSNVPSDSMSVPYVSDAQVSSATTAPHSIIDQRPSSVSPEVVANATTSIQGHNNTHEHFNSTAISADETRATAPVPRPISDCAMHSASESGVGGHQPKGDDDELLVSTNAESSDSSAINRQTKGKGKAVTIEDSQEDVD